MINFEDAGVPFAIVRSNDDLVDGIRSRSGKQKSPIVLYATREPHPEGFDSIDLADMKLNDHYLEMIPNFESPERTYLAGATGCGKTSTIVNRMLAYKEFFPNNPIYFLSLVEQDDVLDDWEDLFERIPTDESIIGSQFDMEQMRDSLVVMDDCDVHPDPKIRKALDALMNNILVRGRHFRISLYCVGHVVCNGASTNLALTQASEIVFFPFHMVPAKLRYLAENHIGLGKEHLRYIMGHEPMSTSITLKRGASALPIIVGNTFAFIVKPQF